MNMNRTKFSLVAFLFVLLFTTNTPSVFSQNWKLYKKNAALDCRYFTTDGLNNIYVITSKNEILKYNQDGSFDSRFVSLKMGKLGTVDASNPFKLLLYYPDFQTVQMLDKDLNSLGSFNLNDLGIAQTGGIAMSDDGRTWVYDAAENKLKTVNGDAGRQVQSAVVPFVGSAVSQMVFRGNTLYVNVPDKGIYLFDRFGKFIKTLDIKNSNYFQVIDNQLFYSQNGQLFRFQLQTLQTLPVKMPEGIVGTELMRLQKNWLFVQQGKTIIVHEEKAQ